MNRRAVLLSVGAFILAAGGIFWLMSKDSTNQKNLPPVAVSSKTAPRLSPQNVPQPPHRPAPPNGVKTANNAAVSTPIQDKYVLHSTHPGRAEMPPPDYFPRPKSEWQGMKIDMTLRPFCDETAQCALGLVCREEHCLPCLKDDECLADEVCVLDHCVRHELAECTQKADCGEEELCVLTGYSSDPRGNSSMRAVCSKTVGEWTYSNNQNDSEKEKTTAPAPVKAPNADKSREKIMNRLEQALDSEENTSH